VANSGRSRVSGGFWINAPGIFFSQRRAKRNIEQISAKNKDNDDGRND
jgi:hypothetical protein